MSTKRRSFGKLRQLPSRRWQASYAGPDLQRHVAPVTFDGKGYAEKWLEVERQLIEREEWSPGGSNRACPSAVGTRTYPWNCTAPSGGPQDYL